MSNSQASREPPYVFANMFDLTFGDNDVMIGFGIETKGETSEKVTQVRVMMTPRSVKILTHLLSATIQKFEKEAGTIPVAPGQLEALTEKILKAEAVKRTF